MRKPGWGEPSVWVAEATRAPSSNPPNLTWFILAIQSYYDPRVRLTGSGVVLPSSQWELMVLPYSG